MSTTPESFVVKQLKRIHDEAGNAIENEDYRSSAAIAGQFNDLLKKVQSTYSSKDRIQEIEEAKSISAGIDNMSGVSPAMNELRHVKLKTLKIADSLEVDTDDFEKAGETSEMIVLNVEQSQSVNQHMSVSNLISEVDNKMMSNSERKELKDIIERFDEELTKEDPNASQVRDWINEARVKSPDAAKKLQMIALERGFDLLTGL